MKTAEWLAVAIMGIVGIAVCVAAIWKSFRIGAKYPSHISYENYHFYRTRKHDDSIVQIYILYAAVLGVAIVKLLADYEHLAPLGVVVYVGLAASFVACIAAYLYGLLIVREKRAEAYRLVQAEYSKHESLLYYLARARQSAQVEYEPLRAALEAKIAAEQAVAAAKVAAYTEHAPLSKAQGAVDEFIRSPHAHT